MEKLQEINKLASLETSRALSKLTNSSIEVNISGAQVKKVEELSPIIGPEEMVGGIYLPVTGDIKGATLLMFPKETTFTLCDLLIKREPGTTRELSELDKSALEEMGNILSGTYLATLSNALEIKLIEHIPSFSLDMSGAIISQIIADFARKAEKALIVEIELIFKPVGLKGYFVFLFELEGIKAIRGLMNSI